MKLKQMAKMSRKDFYRTWGFIRSLSAYPSTAKRNKGSENFNSSYIFESDPKKAYRKYRKEINRKFKQHV